MLFFRLLMIANLARVAAIPLAPRTTSLLQVADEANVTTSHVSVASADCVDLPLTGAWSGYTCPN